MESWPVTAPELELTHADVRRNLQRARALMTRHEIDAIVVTSNDRHLNEYTPRADNQRYHLSGFTGSTALMLVPRDGRAKLFVDGRYHLQAELEVDPADVEVVKVPFTSYVTASLLERVRGLGRVGYESERVSKSMEDALAKEAKAIVPLGPGELELALEQSAPEPSKPLHFIDPAISGRTTAEKLEAVFASVAEPDVTIILVGALDDLAWLSEGRGYHFLYQSSFAARGFVTRDSIHVSIAPAVFERGVARAPARVSWHLEAPEAVLRSAAFDFVKIALYDPSSVTAAYVQRVAQARPEWRLTPQPSPVVAAKALKTPAEIAHFEVINDRSSRAVAQTIRWVRRRLAARERVSEHDFYEAANGFYAAEGARDLSFHTIAAIGANSAIIHFSSPSKDVTASPGDLMLLDSGALYEGGFATDITRTFLADGRGRGDERQRRLYTLVLKGVLSAMSSIFPEGTRGAYLDALARQPIYEAGLDYAHGTGHGVGIHVHEPGVSISSASTLPIKAGHVSSIEPGIYEPGFGGVRLENVVVYEPVPDVKGFLRARPLNYVGFDRCLIDDAMLSPRERAALAAYQAECARRGTDVTDAD
jgi:Xaa-Pro aminopeptidase